MKYNKLERMSSLIEWILLFALLATPLMTLTDTWSHLLGGNDSLHDELVKALGLGMTVAALMAICGVLFEPLGGGIFFIMVLVVLPVFVLRLRGEHEGTAA